MLANWCVNTSEYLLIHNARRLQQHVAVLGSLKLPLHDFYPLLRCEAVIEAIGAYTVRYTGVTPVTVPIRPHTAGRPSLTHASATPAHRPLTHLRPAPHAHPP